VLRAPIVGPELLAALADALDLQREALRQGEPAMKDGVTVDELGDLLDGATARPPTGAAAWRALLDGLLAKAEPLVTSPSPDGVVPESGWWAERFAALARGARDELERLVAPGAAAAEASGVPSPCDLAARSGAADDLVARFERVADLAETLARETDFQLVFDPSRRLFSIGFNVVTGQLDGSSYDLLASEARLASLVAIAFDQVPQSHWFRLGRQLAPTGDGRVLVSWSGTMFEYLMPLLVTRRYPQTLLDETYDSVVEHQIAYGARRGVPWGISESAFNILDLALNYQYRAFGVPGLGLKPGLGSDLVVAPYATVLALAVAPGTALANLRALAREGMDGRFGYYEAIDYTPTRVPPGRNAVVVRAFMAHHQGMSLVALDNALHGDAMVRRFHAEPRIRATELLLQERVPGPVEVFEPRISEDGREPMAALADEGPTERIARLDRRIPDSMLLSNGTYSVLVTAAGAGTSSFRELAVTRWREDPTLDVGGTFCYVRAAANAGRGMGTAPSPAAPPFWSNTFLPARVPPDEYGVVYAPEAGRFRRRDGDIETVTEVTVSPEAHAEVRRVTLANLGQQTVRLDVTSYAEVALAARADDLAHPAFGNLFVETEYDAETGALLCSRRPRSAAEERIWMFHVSAAEGQVAPVTEYETSRARFIGRGRDPSRPAAVRPGARLSNTVGAVLDPAVSLRRIVILSPGDRAMVSFTTGIAESREAALELADTLSDPLATSRTLYLACI
jgi:cyclic beta-1,2-glucan synthetase